MGKFGFIALTWGVLVASVSIAMADDGAQSLEVPAGCAVKAEDFRPVLDVLCSGDLSCAGRVLDMVCNGAMSAH